MFLSIFDASASCQFLSLSIALSSKGILGLKEYFTTEGG